MRMKVCPKCGHEWPDKARFCPNDGTRLDDDTIRAEEPESGASQQAEKPEGGEKSEEGDPNLGTFSATQWFMAAVDPDELTDEASPEELQEKQGKYERDETIPEEKRRRFSLSKKGKKKKKK